MAADPQRQAKKDRANAAKAVRLRAKRQQKRNKIVAIIAVLGLGFVGIGTFVTSGSSSSSSSTTTTSLADANPHPPIVPAGATLTGDTPCPKADGTSARTSTFAKAPPNCLDAGKTYTATFDTTQGTIVTTLDTKTTPNTTNNFIVLARYHYYDGSAIFRIATDIDIIQGGAPNTQDNSSGPGYTINDEGGKFVYAAGDLVMARTGQPNSAGSQYFFVTGPNGAQLNDTGTYVTFGHITTGLDVVQKIEKLSKTRTDSQGNQSEYPSPDVIVNKLTISES